MKNVFYVCAVLLLSSCTPQLYYFGDSHPATDREVEVYYDKNDIKKEFTVIGHLSTDFVRSNSLLEETRKNMIVEAQKRGAEGILIELIYSDQEDSCDNLKGKLLRFEE